MSRRFGRNQKRRLKEQVATMERNVLGLTEQICHMEYLGERNRRIVQLTADVLGRHFITLPADSREVRDIDAITSGCWRFVVSSDAPSFAPWDCRGASIQAPTFLEKVLPVMAGNPAFNDLRGHQHLSFTYNGKKVAYAISEASLNLLPRRDACEMMAKAMAEHLMNEVAK